MILDINPGTHVVIDGLRYTVEEHIAFHDVDFRLDLVHIVGQTPAHERWLVAVLPEPYPMLVQRLAQQWLAPPQTSIVHDGETFINIYRGSANRVRRTRTGRMKDLRMDYAIFRADSGRVIVVTGQNEQLDVWIGATLPADAIEGLKRAE